MASKSKSGRVYAAIDKMEIVRRVLKGESKAAVGRIYNVPESTLRGWCKAEEQKRELENGKFTGQSPSTTMSLDSSTKKRKRSDVDISSEDQDHSSKRMNTILTSMASHGGEVYLNPTSTNPEKDSIISLMNVTQSGGGLVETKNNNDSKYQMPVSMSPLMAICDTVDYTPFFKFLDSPTSSKIDDYRSPNLELSPSSPIYTYNPVAVKLEPVSPGNTYNSVFDFKPLSPLDYSYTEEDEQPLDLTMPKRNSKQDEALEHGKKFLHWLMECGDPRVTQLNILQVRNIIDMFTE